MVIDTSALVAIVFDEPERAPFSEILGSEPILALSSFTLYETSVVVASRKRDAGAIQLIADLLLDFSMEVVDFDVAQSLAARNAYLRYGRGWHAAALNLADCASYSLAQSRSEPLLFKGDDFARTDIVPAWRP